MEYSDMRDLAERMAEKVYVYDMTNVMVPYGEAWDRLEKGNAKQSQDFQTLRSRMYDALVALQELGYELSKD